MNEFFLKQVLLLALLSACTALTVAATPDKQHTNTKTSQYHKDKHYTARGFFDIHVCHWPGRPLFFMALFSTYDYARLRSVSIYDSRGEKLTELDLARYRIIQQPGKPEKHVFIKKIDIPEMTQNGVYSARAEFNDGSYVKAYDHVMIDKLELAHPVFPAPDQELKRVPKELRWQPVRGARYYQVFIKDMWRAGKIIYASKLLTSARLNTAKIGLEPGGMYRWRVHARDVNEDIRLGDFNLGSLTADAEFTIAD